MGVEGEKKEKPKKVIFCVGAPNIELYEDFFMQLNGLIRIIKRERFIWILEFEDRSSAIAAQWMIDAYQNEARRILEEEEEEDENWEKSQVVGFGEKGTFVENVLHRRGDDPMVMAFRRNHALAGCNKVEVDTEEVFTELRMEDAEMERKIRKEKDRREWDWISGGRFSLVLD